MSFSTTEAREQDLVGTPGNRRCYLWRTPLGCLRRQRMQPPAALHQDQSRDRPEAHLPGRGSGSDRWRAIHSRSRLFPDRPRAIRPLGSAERCWPAPHLHVEGAGRVLQHPAGTRLPQEERAIAEAAGRCPGRSRGWTKTNQNRLAAFLTLKDLRAGGSMPAAGILRPLSTPPL